MEMWIVYSLIATVAFGINIIFYKLGASSSNPFLSAVVYGSGILAALVVAFFLMGRNLGGGISSSGLLWLFLAGVIWAVGLLMISMGVANNFDLSKMAAVYNTNFIITIVLSIIVFKELQAGSELLRVLLGSVFVIVGILIVSVK